LNEIRRLNGEIKPNIYPFDRMKSIRRPTYHRRSFDYRFRFRSYVRVVIVIIRLRLLARKWSQKQTAIK